MSRRVAAVTDCQAMPRPLVRITVPMRAFRSAWGKACRKARISGLHFHDLRGTAATRLAEAGCSHAEIASITGHSMRDVGAILDKYLARTDKIALAAIAKLERGAL
jgi:integrase